MGFSFAPPLTYHSAWVGHTRTQMIIYLQFIVKNLDPPLIGPFGFICALAGFSYLPTVWLASCRIRLNCFFILKFCVNTFVGKYSALFVSAHRSVLHRAQNPVCHVSHASLPAAARRKLAPQLHLFAWKKAWIGFYICVCSIAGEGMLDQFTADAQAGSDSGDK